MRLVGAVVLQSRVFDVVVRAGALSHKARLHDVLLQSSPFLHVNMQRKVNPVAYLVGPLGHCSI